MPFDGRMHRQEPVVARRHVVRDLAVRVAGEIDEHGALLGLLVEPVDRHDRERLADGPVVEHRLEHGEVAEVELGELVLELDDLGPRRSRVLRFSAFSRPVQMRQ